MTPLDQKIINFLPDLSEQGKQEANRVLNPEKVKVEWSYKKLCRRAMIRMFFTT